MKSKQTSKTLPTINKINKIKIDLNSSEYIPLKNPKGIQRSLFNTKVLQQKCKIAFQSSIIRHKKVKITIRHNPSITKFIIFKSTIAIINIRCYISGVIKIKNRFITDTFSKTQTKTALSTTTSMPLLASSLNKYSYIHISFLKNNL
mgnify:CR=1 FL=1